MNSLQFRRGATLAATCALVIGAGAVALVALAQPGVPGTAPAATPADGLGEAETPDGKKMPIVKHSEVAVTILIDDLKIGEGKEAKPGDTVLCHYRGTFRDGKEFDSSVKRGEPIEFPLEGVIDGWTMGIPGMKEGGIRRLTIPWPLAYGKRGRAGIPPKSDLIFSIELKQVKDGAPPAAPAPAATPK